MSNNHINTNAQGNYIIFNASNLPVEKLMELNCEQIAAGY